VRQGASWTAAYHLQLTVAAEPRPIRSNVRALGVLAVERSWWLLAQTASARSSVQPVSSAQASSPWSTPPVGTPRRQSPVSTHPVSTHPVSASGIPAVQPSDVRSPGVVVQRSGGRPSAVHPSSVQPSAVQPSGVQPSVRTRLSPPMLRWWRWGPGRGGRATLTTGTGGGPCGCRAVDGSIGWSRRPGRGRRCRSRVGQWEVGGGPRPPGWWGRGGRACR
jgi:hypothetical protein